MGPDKFCPPERPTAAQRATAVAGLDDPSWSVGPADHTGASHILGLGVHEDPYLVTGNPPPLTPGTTFSVEPGSYPAGRRGTRIEDIVVCAPDGVDRLNTTPTELIAL